MDILFIVENANLQGGTEILTFNLMHALQNDGVDSCILSINPYIGKDKNVYSLSDFEYKKWAKKSKSIINKIFINSLSDKYLKSILIEKIELFKPKLIVNQTLDIITALPLNRQNIAQVFNWSLCGYEKSLLNNITKYPFIKRVIIFIFIKLICIRRYKLLNTIPILIALSNSGVKELKSINSKILDKNIRIIPDPLIFSSDSDVISNQNNNNIVFVGRLSNEKGVMRLLRIWKEVNKELSHYTLTIYGDGELKNEMIHYIDENNIKNVIFKGYCNKLKEIYSNADLLCLTSETEGFGMVIIEAKYFGVPCISFDCPVSPKEIIDNAGLVVPCFDENAYKNKIISLLNNKNLLRTLQLNCIEQAKKYYINNIVARWRELL